MNRDTTKRETEVRSRSVRNAVQIRSAEGQGVGRTISGAEDARRLAREAASRAARLKRA
ncbi:hypothetical protein [Conexibacter woesei]|uniref:hypothetical protein n=1 Tax=Conexibacter woesei TaxID=191495 RepID=UPI0012DDD6B4|nr:hypothetical protein [Conexibacter woesei]